MTRPFGRYVRNTDHVIAARSAAVTVENARRAVIARTMQADNAAAARLRAAAAVAAVLWCAVAVVAAIA